MTDSVKTAYRGSIARITLNRPDRRNALDQPAAQALRAAIENIAGRDEVAVVVLEGVGSHFCSGWDLSEFERLSGADDRRVAMYLRDHVQLLRRLSLLPQYTVALVQGYAVGFGAALAISADLAVADPAARFYFPEAEFGLTPAVVLPTLVEALGVRGALRSTLTDAPVSADQALAMGMIGRVAGPRERARLVEKLGKLSPEVVRSTKRMAVKVAKASPAEVERTVEKEGVATLRSEVVRSILERH